MLHIRFLVAAIKSNKAASADQSGGNNSKLVARLFAWHTPLVRGFTLAGSNGFSGAALVTLVTPGSRHVCGMSVACDVLRLSDSLID